LWILNFLYSYATGFSFYENTPPKFFGEAYVHTKKSPCGLGMVRIGAMVSLSFRIANAFSHSFPLEDLICFLKASDEIGYF